MYKSNYNKHKTGLKYKKVCHSQLNKVIVVLSILIIIFIIKTVNNSTSKNMIEIIEKNIYYEFSLEDDGKRVAKYMRKIMGNTIESIEIFNTK